MQHLSLSHQETVASRNKPFQFKSLPAMQRDQQCMYPQVFWTSSSAVSSSDYAPSGLFLNGILPRQDIFPSTPVAEKKRHRQNTRDGTCLCLLVLFLISLLALSGVGLAIFQVSHLQQELKALKELPISGERLQSPEKVKDNARMSVRNTVAGFLLVAFVFRKLGLFSGLIQMVLNGTADLKFKSRAHLTGKAKQNSLPLEWERTYGHAFISGVRYENRGLMIAEAGVYFVYSKVFFRGQACTTKPLYHVVFKRNPSYPGTQLLMEDRKMNYCLATRMWGKSSYLGALFNLSRQDSLHVNVSDVLLVSSEESKTFFGLYML